MRSTVYIPYIVFGYLSLFTLGLLDNARGPYFPDIANSLSLGATSASFLFVTTSFVSFLMGRLVPGFLRQMNLLMLMRFGLLTMGAGMFAMAWITGLYTMIGAAALFGVGYGIVNVAENILILDGSTAAMKRQLLSGLHSFYALASLFAPLFISVFINEGLNWRQGLMIFAAVPLCGLIYSFLCRVQPHISGAAPAELPERFKKDVFFFAVGLGLYVMAEVQLCTRMVLFLNVDHGFETQASAIYLSLFFVFMFMGRLLFTFVKFNGWNNRDIIRYGLFLSAASYALGLFSSPLFLVFTGVFMGPIFAVAIDYISQIFSYASSQALSKVLSLQALLVVSMHFFVGFMTEHLGIKSAMFLGPVFLALSFLIVQLEPWQKRNP